jgi:hypothetical protein
MFKAKDNILSAGMKIIPKGTSPARCAIAERPNQKLIMPEEICSNVSTLNDANELKEARLGHSCSINYLF